MKNSLKILFLVALFFQTLTLAKGPNEIFSFEDEFTCNDKFPHHSFCTAVEFKPWKESEISAIKDIFSQLDRPELQNFFKSINKNGMKKIYRVSYGASWYANHRLRRTQFSRRHDKVLLWVDPVTHVIGVMDNFFSSTEYIDPYAGISRKTLNIMHELIHVFDIANNHISNKSKLKELAGWKWNGKAHVIDGVDYEQVKGKFQKVLEMLSKDPALAYGEDRRMGIEYGFPTIYSMMNSHECFAELMAYYILDPSAKDYLSLAIQKELDRILGLQ